MDSQDVGGVQKIEQKIEKVEDKVFNTVTPSNLPSFSENLKETWNFFVLHKTKIFLYFFLLTLIVQVLTVLSTVTGVVVAASVSPVLLIVLGIPLFVVFIFLSLWQSTITTGSSKFFKDIEGGLYKNTWESYKQMLKFILPLFVVTIVSMFIALAGAVAFIVPGVILSIASAFATTILILEGKKPKEAIVQSFLLTKGRRPYVFFQFLGSVVVIFLASFIAGFIIAVVLSVLPKSGITPLLKTVLETFINAFAGGLVMLFVYTIYKKLVPTKVENGEYEAKTRKLLSWLPWMGGVLFILLMAGLFITVVLASLNHSREKALEAARKIEINTEQQAFDDFVNDNVNIEEDALFEDVNFE